MHVFETEAFYEDTDMGGIVYHANFLKFIERGRSAYVRTLGLDQGKMKRDEGIAFVLRSLQADFLKPAYFEDRLIVHTVCDDATGVRIRLGQSVWREDTELFRASVELVAMRDNGRPTRLPDWLNAALLAGQT